MNILYISNLSTNVAAGLNWSVPATVAAQAEFDNVLWVNLTNIEMPHWRRVEAFHNVDDFCDKGFDIDSLPPPFDRPDAVVFEGFYHPKDPAIAVRLRRRGIPYVITPRGSLTVQSQHGSLRKRLKKMVANHLIFKPYTRNALAIQYLTPAEQHDSGPGWNAQTFVVPNGFMIPSRHKETFSRNGLKAVFIGRLDLYHKGLDVLLNACLQEQKALHESNFTLDIYGPPRYDHAKIKRFIADNDLGRIITLRGEISGEAKQRVLLDADLFVLTSRFEGHPMGLVEAVAYGLPALVTPGSNMADVMEEYDAGWVARQTTESVAAALREILKSRNLLPSKSENARKLSLLYDWRVIAESFHRNLKSSLLKK